jgi:hypothetical protein
MRQAVTLPLHSSGQVLSILNEFCLTVGDLAPDYLRLLDLISE